MIRPLHSAILGSAAVMALSVGAALAATAPADTAPKAKQHVVIVRSENGQTTTYDSDVDGGAPMTLALNSADMGPMGPEPGGMMIRMHHDDPERMAKHLRAVLQLTPAQEPALQNFLAASKPAERPEHERMMAFHLAKGPDGKIDPAKAKEEAARFHAEMEKHRAEMEAKRAADAAMTTPQRLDAMLKHSEEDMARRQGDLRNHVSAVKAFYAALTPAQQKAFDALHEGGMGGGMHEYGGPEMRMEMHRAMAPMPPMPPLPPLPPAPPAPPPPPGA